MIIKLNLQQFAEEGAAAAPESAGAETAEAAVSTEPAMPAAQGAETAVNAGDQLPDGTTVKSAQVAAALQKQMKRHPELRQVYGKGQPAPAAQAAGNVAESEKSIEDRWNEVKRGEFAEFYGRDVQNAVMERFKNQAQQQEQLDKLQPMLNVFMERAGVNNVDDLIKQVMDDDSIYEEEANKRGMTIPAYRQMMELESKMHERQEAEQQRQENARIQQHFANLQQQAERMKQIYPNFNLQEELKNKDFFKLTRPEIGISVEDAYYAVHHKELAPQMMAYGMERARTQLGQTIQAQRSRPAEGAMKQKGQPAAAVRIDPRNLTREERAEIKRQVRMGMRVSFD